MPLVASLVAVLLSLLLVPAAIRVHYRLLVKSLVLQAIAE